MTDKLPPADKQPPPKNKPDQEIRYNDDGTVDLPGLIGDDSQDMRPYEDITDEFSRRKTLSDDHSGNRGADDTFRRTGHKSRILDFLRSRLTNPQQDDDPKPTTEI
jgi:hypothetical protein